MQDFEPRFVKWCHQLVEGLDYLHSQGITNCDLKPTNMMIDENDNVLLSDFDTSRQNDGNISSPVGD